MGAAATTLSECAIHVTNRPGSVGGFVSHGCIRTLNEDISDLYSHVSLGTTNGRDPPTELMPGFRGGLRFAAASTR